MEFIFFIAPVFVVAFGVAFFIVVIAYILAPVLRGAAEWIDRQPVQGANARVTAKHSETGMFNSHQYFATFEFQNGERQEYRVGRGEFGLLAEGDRGWLIFQGTRYRGFERARAGDQAAHRLEEVVDSESPRQWAD